MEKLFKSLEKLSHIFELITAFFVVIAVLIGLCSLAMELVHIPMSDTARFIEHYIKDILEVVIGIEFLKMLLKPDADSILEVLIFVVTRHMIVQSTSVYEDLIVIISVAILLILKQKLKEKKTE
ncbi:hypothetical protein P261_01117 [Lachnospiraceae bacterium TWA4]|nr:hypothetical protein P261_01117 [Lachnospiraceae bacterium TWA4]